MLGCKTLNSSAILPATHKKKQKRAPKEKRRQRKLHPGRKPLGAKWEVIVNAFGVLWPRAEQAFCILAVTFETEMARLASFAMHPAQVLVSWNTAARSYANPANHACPCPEFQTKRALCMILHQRSVDLNVRFRSCHSYGKSQKHQPTQRHRCRLLDWLLGKRPMRLLVSLLRKCCRASQFTQSWLTFQLRHRSCTHLPPPETRRGQGSVGTLLALKARVLDRLMPTLPRLCRALVVQATLRR